MIIKYIGHNTIKQKRGKTRLLTHKVVNKDIVTVLTKENLELVSWNYPRFYRLIGL